VVENPSRDAALLLPGVTVLELTTLSDRSPKCTVIWLFGFALHPAGNPDPSYLQFDPSVAYDDEFKQLCGEYFASPSDFDAMKLARLAELALAHQQSRFEQRQAAETARKKAISDKAAATRKRKAAAELASKQEKDPYYQHEMWLMTHGEKGRPCYKELGKFKHKFDSKWADWFLPEKPSSSSSSSTSSSSSSSSSSTSS
jgi:hypothetical protein